MSESEFTDEILGRVDVDRRTFVKRAILGSAFAVPIVASFEMGTLTAHAKSSQTGNGTTQPGTKRPTQPGTKRPKDDGGA